MSQLGSVRIRIEESCPCGNKDDAEYRLYETDLGATIFGKQCVICDTEWLPKEYHLLNSPPTVNTDLILYPREPPITSSRVVVSRRRTSKCNKVVEGNHITWRDERGHWCHGIVAKVDGYGFGVIQWTEVTDRQLKVTKKYLPTAEDQVYFRFEYPEGIERANDLNLVLARAYSRLGDKKDGLLKDNALSFAAFCKTGSENPLLVNIKDEIGFGDQCDCGNDDPVKFRQYRDKDSAGNLLGKRCNLCKVEWLRGEFHVEMPDDVDGTIKDQRLFRRDPPELEENTALKIRSQRTKIDRRVDTLKPGDHIAWERAFGHWHHAVVVRVENKQNKTNIVVINWTMEFGRILCNGWNAIEVVEESLPAEVDQDSLYRVDYPADIVKSNDPKLVLARARSRIGDTGYGILSDNCETFATYCKTGSEVCHQKAWLAKKGVEILASAGVTFAKDAAKQIMGGISALAKEAALKEANEEAIAFFVKEATKKAVGSLKSALPQITDKGAKELVKQYVENSWKVTMAESIEKIKNATNWVGVGVVFALELFFCVRDITRIYREKKAGKLSRRDWIKEATQRTSEGVSSAFFTCLGSLLGSFTPLGPFFGSVIGGAIGSYLGKHLGTSVGGRIGRVVARQFDEKRAVRGIEDLKPGDHISFEHDACPHKKCHAIVKEREQNEKVKVIRDTHDRNRGFAEEQLNIKELPNLRIEDETDACGDPNKIVTYAVVKTFEDYEDDDSYKCKDFARECRRESKNI
ncbi:uncharacterized protein [Amphiura filiformis]|uniref:uncharacterized protein n=1 Tax=Amphiura filiformis TaxID=82378 RepID=UPI003B210274